MEYDSFQIQNRLNEIEVEIQALAEQSGASSLEDLLSNPFGKEVSILTSIVVSLTEKLKLQKTLFKLNGGDLSNVVLLSERR